MLRRPTTRRRGVTVVECAFVYPLTILLLFGMVVGATGVFRYQEVASLAREAARYASTHGANFRKDTGLPVGTAGTACSGPGSLLWYQADPSLAPGADPSWCQDIYDNAVAPNLVALDPSQITCQVGWPAVINQSNKPDNWPGSTVTVTISYQWMPEYFWTGPITLTSTSSMPITN